MDSVAAFLAVNSGSGYGCGDGYGDGDGYGSGDGSGYGDGSGSGDGSGYGDGLETYNGQPVHYIDGVQTILHSAKGNLAKGATIGNDLQFTACFVAKDGDFFGHGATAHGAMAEAKRKALDNEPVETKVERFLAEFPHGDQHEARALFDAHGWLTGSCLYGRKQWVKDRGIDLSGKMTVAEFVALCGNAYGGEIVRMLAAEPGAERSEG